MKYQLIKTMGIDGLLLLLKPITQKQHISAFKGKTLGVDASPWLYKGCYNHVLQTDDISLITDKSYSCSAYLLNMLSLFETYKIKPIFVFDGRSLSLKKNTINKRINTREQNMKKAQNMLQRNNIKEGRKFTARGITIDESITVQAMCILKTKHIQFIVAPYQADSQLAKLRKLSIIDAVVSQDSDLLAYGCNTIYKLDEEGMCDYVDLQHTNNNITCKYVKSFLSFDQDTKLIACVLAGCDYVNSIKGIGIKKAIKLVQNESDFLKLLQNLRNDKLYADKIATDYEDKTINAINIFKYALTFNPILKTMESLQPRPQDNELHIYDSIGAPYTEYLKLGIYKGQVNPKTLAERNIKQVEIVSIQKINDIKLSYLKRGESMSDMSSNEIDGMNDEMENQMLEAMKSLETGVEQSLWPYHQQLVNTCILSIFYQ